MFGPALIFDSEDEDGVAIRLLNVNGTFQSICYTDKALRWELVCVYHRTMAQVIAQQANRTILSSKNNLHVLVIGGGGFSLPKWIVAHIPDAQVDVIEIDAAILEIAREHFYLNELEELIKEDAQNIQRLTIINEDALVWLHEQALVRAGSYDIVITDAFAGRKPLGPLGSVEGAEQLKGLLVSGGVLLANVRSHITNPLTGGRASSLKRVEAAYENVFGEVELIPEWEEMPEKLQNNVLVAHKA